jgi:single-strand DNA-binding protein
VYDTPIVIVGNVLNAPEWRRTAKNNTLVANFRVASTSRRFDRDNNRWVDGDTLRVRVNCWRRLAENVGASVTVGDPIVVVGRLYTRDWVDGENNPRVAYEMEAYAVGHDLSRGRTKLFRTRPGATSSTPDGPDADGVVRGESTEPLAESPIGYGEGIPDDIDEPPFVESPPDSDAGPDPVTTLPGGGTEPFDKDISAPEMEMEVERVTEDAAKRRSRRRRETVAA